MVPSSYGPWLQSPTSTPPALKETQRLPQPSPSYHDPKDKPKKPRHRHSAFQLAALNELYDRDEHPPLEERTSLAERLGMSVCSVLLSRYGRLIAGELQGGEDGQCLVPEQTSFDQEADKQSWQYQQQFE